MPSLDFVHYLDRTKNIIFTMPIYIDIDIYQIIIALNDKMLGDEGTSEWWATKCNDTAIGFNFRV